MNISKNSFLFEIWVISINPFLYLSAFFARPGNSEPWRMLGKSSIKPPDRISEPGSWHGQAAVIGNRVSEIGGRLCLEDGGGLMPSERARNVKVVSLYMRDSLSCHNSHHSGGIGAAAAASCTAAKNANGQNQSCAHAQMFF